MVKSPETMAASNPTRLILLVEDRVDRVDTIGEVLRGSSFPYRLINIGTPDRVLRYLRRQGDYSEAIRPDLILLSLNLADSDGRELLRDIKSDPQLRRMPIVVLTDGISSSDVLDIYALHGNSCTIADREREQLSRIIKRIEDFWFGIVTLPSE
jgi:two-component system, chemotaxis family, response regulator Rcp1